MSTYRKILPYAVVGIGLICVALTVRHYTQLNAAAPLFADMLHAQSIRETVEYRGQEYDIGGSDGYDAPVGALLLAYHKASARFAPLLAMPNEDPEVFFTSVGQLSNVQGRIAQKQQDPDDARYIRDNLYPVALLRVFGQLEDARLAFLKSGSERDAKHYTRLQREVFATYDEAIDGFRRGFTSSVPESAKQYATNTRLVSREDVLAALEELETAMEATEDLWQERLRCVRGRASSCTVADVTLPPLNARTGPVPPISAQQYAHAIDARNMFINSEVRIDTDTFYQLGSSVCVKEFPQTALLYTFETTRGKDGKEFRSPFYVGDALALATAPVANLPFFEYFAEHGIEYVPARPNKYYRCPESGAEAGLLLALESIRTFALNTPIHGLLPDSDQAEFEALEKRLASPIVSETDIAAYASRIVDPAIRAQLSPDQAEEAIQIYLSLAYGSAGMPHTVREIVDNEEMNMTLSERGVSIDPGALFMFFARSAFVPLFLGDNSSAAGNHAPLFKENTLPDEVQPTVYLSRLPRTPAIRDKVLRDFTFYQRVHTYDGMQNPLSVSTQ